MSAGPSKPRLTYFAGRGLGEIPRLVLAAAGVEFEDVRLDDISKLKADGSLPFGQVPLYEHKDFKLSQSMSISRYIAAGHGLYGSSLEESAKIDMLCDGLGDIRGKLGQQYALPEDQRAAFKAKFAKETLPNWVQMFEKLLKQNHEGKGFFVGNKLSLADIAVFNTFQSLKSDYPDAFANTPLLDAFYTRVAEIPKIAHWLKTRPVTPW